MPARKGDPRGARRARRVLVVDDDLDIAALWAHTLERGGYATTVATDPFEAFLIARQLRPHVALLDIGLPGMDGHELGLRLRSFVRKEVRLIAITGFDQPSVRRRSMECGFDEHLVKPVRLAELLQLVCALAPLVSTR